VAGSTYLEKEKGAPSSFFFLSSYEDAKARRKPTEGDFLPVVQGGKGMPEGDDAELGEGVESARVLSGWRRTGVPT